MVPAAVLRSYIWRSTGKSVPPVWVCGESTLPLAVTFSNPSRAQFTFDSHFLVDLLHERVVLRSPTAGAW